MKYDKTQDMFMIFTLPKLGWSTSNALLPLGFNHFHF